MIICVIIISLGIGAIPTPPVPPTTRTTLLEEAGDDDDGGEVFDSSVTAAETNIDL